MKKLENPFVHLEGYNNYAWSPKNPWGLKMEGWIDEESGDVVCYWQPHTNFQGWIDTLHGGVQAALIDEVCYWAVLHHIKKKAVTAKLEMRYLKPIKTNEGELTLRARIVEQRRNLITIEAEIYNNAGELCTKGSTLYFATTDIEQR